MVAYSFKQRFSAPIIAGTKRQTIRADRKRHARAGEQLQLYTGMRTKQCKLIARATCIGVDLVMLNLADHGVVRINGIVLFSDAAMQKFARSDGFASWADMRDFWRDNHPGVEVFEGMLIRWGDIA
ncbi:ASCH domain-containing protein [bacterium M00.F.Ca.ET.159.01.1.1]|nr:ASCH domain-containing protein [bacterium M00.F.Ca.ET.159.01.1.1]